MDNQHTILFVTNPTILCIEFINNRANASISVYVSLKLPYRINALIRTHHFMRIFVMHPYHEIASSLIA